MGAMSFEQLAERIARAIAGQLNQPPAAISWSQSFLEMGIESLQAVQILHELSEDLGQPLSPTLFFDYPNITSLARHLTEGPAATPSPAPIEFNSEPIAVVGIGARFPGCESLQEFWQLLMEGQDAITEFPKDRWPPERNPKVPWGGFIKDWDTFDAKAFGVSEAEAVAMDPQQRLLLTTAWQAIEDARLSVSGLRGTNTGVFVGMSSHDYSLRSTQSHHALKIFDIPGNSHSISANRLSYFFDFKGPSLAVDTACSSSLVAVHGAVTALQSGLCDYALAAGVNLLLSPEITDVFLDSGMLSPEGRCRTFSEGANGYVRGEGCGVIMLCALSRARELGLRIYAVLHGAAVNQDGRTNGLTAPSGPQQVRVLRQALAMAKVQPQQIAYVEAHGTGTALGDPIEFRSLAEVFGERESPCWLGSVKSNIGHLEAAAGMAGLIKVCLSISHRQIPPSLHFKSLNRHIQPTPRLQVVTQVQPWPEAGLAGVSSFGFGGTNAHVIVGAEPSLPPPEVATNPLFDLGLVVRFANTSREASLTQAEVLATSLSQTPNEKQWAEGISSRHEFDWKTAAFALNRSDLASALTKFSQGQPVTVVQKTTRSDRAPSLGILFTGQGSQWVGMGYALYKASPVFRHHLDECVDQFNRHFHFDLLGVMFGFEPQAATLLQQTDYGQAAIFSLEYALYRLFEASFSLAPKAVFGHSLGEITAAVVAQQLTLNDAVLLITARGQWMQKTAAGAMIAVEASPDQVRSWMVGLNLDLAAINGPRSVVVSGTVENIRRFQSGLNEKSIRSKSLQVERAFHSRLMDPIGKEFAAAIANITFSSPQIPIVSSLTGRWQNESQIGPDYWREHLRQPTQFLAAMELLKETGITHFLEVGPHGILCSMASQFLNDMEWIPTLRREGQDALECLRASAQLLVNGYSLKGEWRPSAFDLPPTVFTQRHYRGEWLNQFEMKQETPMSTPENRRPHLLGELKSILAPLLKVSPDELVEDLPLVDLGADSLLLLNALQTVKDRYQVTIAISDVFNEVSTLGKLTDHILKQTPPPVQPVQIQPRTTPAFAQPLLAEASDLKTLIESQLRIMALQLEALKGSSPSGLQPNGKSTSTSKPLTEPNREKKGVLGNFKTKVDVSETQDQRATYAQTVVNTWNEKTPKTKALTQKYRAALADNRTSAGFRPRTKEMIYPVVCEEARGSRFKDIDGNEYIDFTMGFGVNLFGHSPRFIEEAVSAQLKKGMAVGPQSALAGPVAQLFCELTGQERVAFCNSGTEAVMTAIRLARAATQRQKIVIFDGSYHGHFDGVLGRAKDLSGALPVAPGVTPGFVDDVVVLEYGSEEALRQIEALGPELAAVLVEPVQSRYPENQPKEFLERLRAITTASQTAFIWDEVITGFRIRVGGAQEHFGIQADLATYGKVLGGGLPIGAVGGQARFMNAIDGGFWSFGDHSYPQAEMTFFAGTFCKHPLAMAAAQATLSELKNRGPELLSELTQRTSKLVVCLNEIFTEQGVELKAYHFGSLFRFKGSLNLELFFANLNARGFYIWEGRNLFLSTVHTEAEIAAFVQAVGEVTAELVTEGIFPSSKKNSSTTLSIETIPFIESQIRFQKLSAESEAGEQAGHICVGVKMKGPLHPALLKSAVNQVLRHYDLCRFRASLESGTQWLTKWQDLVWEEGTFTQERRPWRALDEKLKAFGAKKFTLQNEPPVRFALYAVATETWVMAVVAHHLYFDGWSLAQLFEEFAAQYRALVKEEPFSLPPRLPYFEYLTHPERWGSAERLQKTEKYWQDKLKNIQAVPSVSPDCAGRRFAFDLDYSLYEKIKAICKSQRWSPLAFFMTGFYHHLKAKGRAKDSVVIGTPAPNRDLPGTDKMIGHASNLLPIVLPNSLTDSIPEDVKTVQTLIRETLAHMTCPYERMKELVGGEVFQMILNVEPTSELPDFDDVSLLVYPFPITASEHDLVINISDLEYGYHVEFDFKEPFMTEDEAIQLSQALTQEFRAMVKTSSAEATSVQGSP